MSQHLTNKQRRSRSPEMLSDLAQTVSQKLQNLVELDKDLSEHVGLEVARCIAEHWGGQYIYFLKDDNFIRPSRDQQIYDEFTGNNHSELVRKYGISLQWLYSIIKYKRKEELERRQPSLNF